MRSSRRRNASSNSAAASTLVLRLKIPLNHIALINRHPLRVVAHLDTLAAAGAALGKAAIAGRAGWGWWLVVGWLGRNIAFAGGFERHRLTFDAQTVIWLGLALFATRATACAGAVTLALVLLLTLPLLAGLSSLTGLLAGRWLVGLIGLLAGLRLRQMLDRPREVIKRLGRILPALLQPIGALFELVGQLRVA